MTTNPALDDQSQRDDIARRLDETLFVEAGAGTGKTTALVSRIVGLVCGGIELRDIAAITFTEKAAAELKDRLRDELETAAADVARPQAERDRCAAATEQIDGAAIQTLHSFAQRILAQYPIEAGLPPVLELRDEIRAALAFDDRWAQFLDALLSEPGNALPLEEAVMLGLDVRSLRPVATAFHQHWDRLRGTKPMFEASTSGPLDVSALQAAVADAIAAVEFCDGCDDLLEQHIRRVMPAFAARLERAQDDDERIAALVETWNLGVKGNIGKAEHWKGPTKAEARALVDEVAAERDRILSERRAACLAPLLEALRGFVITYMEERRRAGTLEFHDLLLMARDLLAGDATVRQRLGRRYRRLLIDEFQDTDPVQVEIAALLASSAAEAGNAWDELAIEAGRLFFVGDPKQSIYRFRSADIELYERAHERFGQETRYLTVNFRSAPGIIGWVNATFADMFAEVPASDGPGQVTYVPLTAAPGRKDSPQAKGQPTEPVRLIGGRHEPSKSAPGTKDPNVKVVRRAEAAEISDVIQSIRREGWSVSESGGARTARYADITILLPARTTLAAIERALEEDGVPFRVESQSLLYATQEVRDLTSVLAAIDDPTDQVAVVAALRSPAFACSDPELEEWATNAGRWDYTADYHGELDEDHAVHESMTALLALHNARWFMGVNEMVERVIRERRLFEVAFANRRPRETWQRLRFVLERARAFEDAGGASLRQFVEWLRQQAATEVRVTESVVPESDDDAVRIMTVHAAKGLEFPVVILAGLNTDPVVRHPSVLWRADGVPEVRVGKVADGFESPGYHAALAHEDAMDRLEKDRLLYVAATRARDHLIVSLHHKPPKKVASHAARLHDRWVTVSRWRPESREQQAPLFGQDLPTEVDTIEAREAWAARRNAAIERLRRAPVFAATAIAHGPAAAHEDDKPEPDDDDAPWRRGRAGTAIGRAVHAVLQSIDFETGEGLEATARAQAAAEGLAGREHEVAALARSAIASETVKEAVRGRYWREVYVAAPVGEAVIEGFIDLLYEQPEGLVVVDYKTDSAKTDAQIDAAMDRYRRQGAAYALALGEALGRPVAKCVFLFVSTTAAQVRTVFDLGGEIAAVREAVDARIAR
jgi:ATP-dependent exoDNAse (exonuclease V) beta subunit